MELVALKNVARIPDELPLHENFDNFQPHEIITLEDIHPIDYEVNYSKIDHELSTLVRPQTTTILNCPSMNDAVNEISKIHRDYFLTNNTALCASFKINNNISECSDIQFHDIIENFKLFERSFIISFESTTDGKSFIYWKLRSDEPFQIYSLEIRENISEVGDLVRKFLVNALRDGHSAICPSFNFPSHQIKIKIEPQMIRNKNEFNLLFYAAYEGNEGAVRYFIPLLNVHEVRNDKTPIDIAWENEHYEIVLAFLKANSRFPSNFSVPRNNPAFPIPLKRFSFTSVKMHDAIRQKKIDEIIEIIKENPGQKFFFSRKNVSALAYAIERKEFVIYKVLIKRQIFLGPHEIFNDILEKLEINDKKQLKEIHDDHVQPIADKHLMTLMSNTDVGYDDQESNKRLAVVFKAFQKLNSIDEIRILLKYVAATRKFQFIFDFNRDHILQLDPTSDKDTNGVIYLGTGRIYIGASKFLDEKKFNEVCAVIAHEITHFVINHVYKNNGNPYTADNHNDRTEIQMILLTCMALKDAEKIIEYVNGYDEEFKHAEIIVRGPHMIVHYIDEPEKLQELKETFPELMRFFYQKCIPKIEEKLPEVEKENEDRARDENKKMNGPKYSCCMDLFIFLLSLSVVFVIIFLLVGIYVDKSEKIVTITSWGNFKCNANESIECFTKNDFTQCKLNFEDELKDCKKWNDYDCENNLCKALKCIDPCYDVTCGSNTNTKCVVINEEPVCTCDDGLVWFEDLKECHECKSDDHCLNSLTCEDKKCVDPCLDYSCGSDEFYCVARNHKAVCECVNDLILYNSKCHECVTDKNCKQPQICDGYKCLDACDLGFAESRIKYDCRGIFIKNFNNKTESLYKRDEVDGRTYKSDVSFTIYGDIINPPIKLKEDLFAQIDDDNVLSVFGRSLFLYDYLKKIGKISQENENLIMKELTRGYEKVKHYQIENGGFAEKLIIRESVIITAYTTWLLGQAYKLGIKIDKKVISDALSYCISQQQDDGSFYTYEMDNDGLINGYDSSSNVDYLTVITSQALIENSEIFEDETKKVFLAAIQRAKNFLETKNDFPLVVKVMAYNSMQLGDRKEIEELLDTNREDVGNFLYWHDINRLDKSRSIFVTSQIAHFYLNKNKIEKILPIIRWILNQEHPSKNNKITFESVVAMQIISIFADKFLAGSEEQNLRIEFKNSNEKVEKSLSTLNSMDVQHFYMKIDESQININAEGTGHAFVKACEIYETEDVENAAQNYKIIIKSDDGVKFSFCVEAIDGSTAFDYDLKMFVHFTNGYEGISYKYHRSVMNLDDKNSKIDSKFNGQFLKFTKDSEDKNNCIEIITEKKNDHLKFEKSSVTVMDSKNRGKYTRKYFLPGSYCDSSLQKH